MPLALPLTWTCHVCGRERPDDLIAVYSSRWRFVDAPMPPGVEVVQNVRFCVDTPACEAGAREVSFLANEAAGRHAFERVEP